jgi:hypothetical protein
MSTLDCKSPNPPPHATPPTAAGRPVHDPDEDYISTLLLELGQATAIVDLLWTVVRKNQADSLSKDSLDNSLYTVWERLNAVKVAADAILDEMSAAARGAPPTDKAISTYATAAAEYGLPMWAMVIPGTTRDMFEDLSKMKRLVRLMSDYLACSDTQRGDIETIADDIAELNRQRATEVAHG